MTLPTFRGKLPPWSKKWQPSLDRLLLPVRDHNLVNPKLACQLRQRRLALDRLQTLPSP